MTKKSVIIAVVIAMTVLAAFLAMHAHAGDPYQRFSSFSKSHPNVKVSFEANFNGKPAGTGTILFQRPFRNLFTVNFGGDSFSAVNTDSGYLELDRASSTYDEAPAIPVIGVRESRVSPLTEAAPSWIFVNDLHKGLPKNADISHKGDGDEIHGKVSNPMGSMEAWIDVNQEGEITYYRIKSTGERGFSDKSWNLKYEFPTQLKPADFSLAIPLGYVPYALPPENTPLQKKGVVPVAGWSRKGGSGTVNLLDEAGHKQFLLAVLDGEGPSKRALPVLASLKSQLPVLIVGPGGLSDPSGKLLEKLNPAGYPSFYLVSADGKLVQLWFGVDSDSGGKFKAEVLAAASGKASS